MIDDPDNRPAAGLLVRELRELIRHELETVADQCAPTPRLLTQEETAEALGVSSRTVYKLRKEGCPVVMVGDAPRLDLEHVRAWLAARAQ